MTEEWIETKAACALLGVRKQTLYAYASRHGLRIRKSPEDSRRSEYARADIEALAKRNARPRARADIAAGAIQWGEPVLTTGISQVHEGQLFFGTQRATDLAKVMSMEGITAHHCKCPTPRLKATSISPPDTGSPLAAALSQLARDCATALPMQGRPGHVLANEGQDLLRKVAAAMLGIETMPNRPIHEVLAKTWNVSPEVEDHLRQALVIMSDHELNPSTFAVRVCASTGASMAAALLAGMATLSGPLHGGAALSAQNALVACDKGEQALAAHLSANPNLSPYALGYGHPLYPEGDPRAAYLLGLLKETNRWRTCVTALSQRLGAAPNIDSALACLSLTYDLPEDAPFLIFAIGRVSGWIAHAIEQVNSNAIIRPRAEFVPDA
jgi:citrate synthase